MRCLFLLMALQSFSFLHAQDDSSHYFNSFDGTRIYYEDKGKGDVVVLVHGFVNTSQNWKKTGVYKELLNAGYRVIAPDMRGNGKSDKPHTSEAYANDAEAKDIISLMTSLRINFYNVIGYSRGSITTARLLVLDKRIRKAVLGGMGTDFTNPDWPRRKMFYHALNGDTLISELQPLLKRIETDSSLDRIALTLQQKEQPSTSVQALHNVTKPVLVICGKNDADNGNAKALALLFKNGSYAEVSGDHGFAVTTKEFGTAVILFLSKHKK